ncbi:MAG: GNAT family N-acetyltransferase, partial [Lachnospiraceae bacterium]|nr:GNAT family N-acetyltransferase [Lachnospiraceae bacterium]
MEIVILSSDKLTDMNKANEPFEVIGRLIPSFMNEKWTYTEELYEHPYMKAYPADGSDYSSYIDNPEKAIFLAYEKEECIGQIIVKKDWNKYAFIEDICVLQKGRGQGVGSALIQRTIEWAKELRLSGLALETQDNNLLACRFYAKCGFEIGAVNTMLYKNFEKPWSEEKAVFW